MNERILSVTFLTISMLTAPVVATGEEPRLAQKPFELLDGDQVVLFGASLLFAEQSHGYLEAAMTSRFPDRHVTFRNLHVRYLAKGNAENHDPFPRQRKLCETFRPRVALIGYEESSAAGAEDQFIKNMDILKGAFRLEKARIVAVIPPPVEKLSDASPDPPNSNARLLAESAAIRRTVAAEGWYLMDLFEERGRGNEKRDFPLTHGGGFLSAFSYWQIAPAALKALGIQSPEWLIDIDAVKGPTKASSNPHHRIHDQPCSRVVQSDGHVLAAAACAPSC